MQVDIYSFGVVLWVRFSCTELWNVHANEFKMHPSNVVLALHSAW